MKAVSPSRLPAAPPDRPGAHRTSTALLEGAWRVGLLPEPPLDAASLEAAAIRRTGLQDFGEGWREPFAALLGALRDEAALNAVGRTLASGQIGKLLCDRLRAYDLWRRHPEILDRPLAPPVIVLGQMRSGTTRLQRLLACDPHFLNSRFFEIFSPIPPAAGSDRRILQARLCLGAMRALNPALHTIHPAAALQPDEQFGLFSFSFYGAQLEAQWRVPGFARFWQGRDRNPVYAEFRRLLQTISWARGDDPAKPWLLKAPQFMEDLEPLLAAFPGARLLCLHRDPAAVVGSSASLVWNQMLVQSDQVDRLWIGGEWLEKTARREESCARARRLHSSVPQLDIDYSKMDEDWRGEMQRIYDFLGRPLDMDSQSRMQRYLAAAAAGGYGRHSYRLEEFGLSPGAVRARLDSRADHSTEKKAVTVSRPSAGSGESAALAAIAPLCSR